MVQLRFILGLVFSHYHYQVVAHKMLKRLGSSIGGAFRSMKLFPRKAIRPRRPSSPEFHFTAFKSCLLSIRVSLKAFSYRYCHRNLSADAILLMDDVSDAAFVLSSLEDSFDVFSVRLIVTRSKRSFFKLVALN